MSICDYACTTALVLESIKLLSYQNTLLPSARPGRPGTRMYARARANSSPSPPHRGPVPAAGCSGPGPGLCIHLTASRAGPKLAAEPPPGACTRSQVKTFFGVDSGFLYKYKQVLRYKKYLSTTTRNHIHVLLKKLLPNLALSP